MLIVSGSLQTFIFWYLYFSIQPKLIFRPGSCFKLNLYKQETEQILFSFINCKFSISVRSKFFQC